MIAIIGGGISGLATAYELQKWCEPVTLFEASAQPGGVIQTEYIDGFQLEYGANSILADESIQEFLRKIGLEDEFFFANSNSKNRFIFRKGKYRNLPAHPLKLLFSNFLSLKSKWAIYKELSKRPEVLNPEETLSEFITRRFNQEISDYILAPFITGIYAGDVRKLLVQETFPILAEYEQKYGSVLKGFIKNRGGARKQSLYFKSGMQKLIQALAQKVKKIEYNAEVQHIRKVDNNYIIHYTQNGTEKEFLCEGIVFSAPAYISSKILQKTYPHFASLLNNINYAPAAKVFLGYDRQQVDYAFKGFGALNPPVENQYTLGTIWNSATFPGCAPENKILLTALVGGAVQYKNLEYSEEEIINKTIQEVSRSFNIKVKPELVHIKKWTKGIPQNEAYMPEIRKEAENLEKENIFISANWLGGPGLSDCLKKADKVALKIVELRSGITDYTGCC
jgi:oxygen-dependent protoporphyrinogen oxidase